MAGHDAGFLQPGPDAAGHEGCPNRRHLLRQYHWFNSNPGTQSQPWQTIQKAVDNVSPGDTIYVLKGEYDESVSFKRSGNADNPILLTHYNQDVVTINGSGSPAIVDNGTQYWIIDSFTLISQAQQTIKLNAWGCDGTCGGTQSWIIRNNKIIGPVLIYGSYNTFEGNEVDGSSNDGDGNGVWEYYDVSHHNTFRNNYIHNFSTRGIWSMHRTHDSLFEGNIVRNIGTATSGDCIDMDGFATVEWRHSIIHNQLSQCGASGLKLENTFDSIVKNNIIHDIGIEAIVEINSIECQVGGENNQYGNNNNCEGLLTANKIIQNLIYRSGNIGSIRILHAGGVDILGNTVAYGTGTGIFLDKVTPQISIKNNILAKNYGSQILFFDSNPLIADDHNLFFVIDPTWVYEVNNKHYSLPGYQSYSDKGQDSITGDPQFTDPGNDNFHPKKNSPSVDAGVSIGVPTDLDGNPRPQGTGFDIGPYEVPFFNMTMKPTSAHKYDIINITITFSTTGKLVTINTSLPNQLDYLNYSTTCTGQVTYNNSRMVIYSSTMTPSPNCNLQISTKVNTNLATRVSATATIDNSISDPENLSATIILNGYFLYLPITQRNK